jgi:hypothetical protein
MPWPADDRIDPAVFGQSNSIGGDGFFSLLEWSVITLSPLPDLPVDTTNNYRDSPAAALLGQKLFFDARLSEAN